jgi:hypothetical protein
MHFSKDRSAAPESPDVGQTRGQIARGRISPGPKSLLRLLKQIGRCKWSCAILERSARVSDRAETTDRRSLWLLETFGRVGSASRRRALSAP